MADTEPIPVIRVAPEPQDYYGTDAVRAAAADALRETAATARWCRDVCERAAGGDRTALRQMRQVLSALNALPGHIARLCMRFEENTAAVAGAMPGPGPQDDPRDHRAARRKGLHALPGGRGLPAPGRVRRPLHEGQRRPALGAGVGLLDERIKAV